MQRKHCPAFIGEEHGAAGFRSKRTRKGSIQQDRDQNRMNLLSIENLSKVFTERQILIMQIFLSTKEKRLVSSVSTEPGKVPFLDHCSWRSRMKSDAWKQLGSWISRRNRSSGRYDGPSGHFGRKRRNKINEWSIESEAKTMLQSLGIDEFEKLHCRRPEEESGTGQCSFKGAGYPDP